MTVDQTLASLKGTAETCAKKVTETCVCQISRLLLYERKKETSQVGRILLDFCLLATRLMLLKCRMRCVPEIALGCLGLLGKLRLWIQTSGLNFSISIPNSVFLSLIQECPTDGRNSVPPDVKVSVIVLVG